MRWDIPVDRGEMSLLRCTGHNAQRAIMKNVTRPSVIQMASRIIALMFWLRLMDE